MVASEMATSVTKPPKLPKGSSAPRSKSTNSHQTSKHSYTRTLKSNSSVNVNHSSVYKSRSDTSLSASIRNLSLRSGSASSHSSASSSATSASRRFNSAGHGSKSVEDIARQIAGKYFKNIVVMAGAGISTASGIPDFRTPGTGLYDNLKQYRIPYPQAIFDIDYFSRCPKPFYTLAKELYPTGKHRPNYVHYFLRLLHEKGILLRVYTQNIDGLERLAGIPPAKVIEAHGSFHSASCVQCKKAYPETEVKGAILGDKVPRCKKPGCYGLVKPDIVFFGEDLPRRFYYYLRDFPQADLLLVMGTSLEVEPFADIVDSVRMYVPRVLFNREAVGPFEKKRRANDIVVEGDIVEKVRGFAVQLGWKKELDILIEESENQYKRSLIESAPAIIQDAGFADSKHTVSSPIHQQQGTPSPSPAKQQLSALHKPAGQQQKSSSSCSAPRPSPLSSSSAPSLQAKAAQLDHSVSKTTQEENKAQESQTQSRPRTQDTKVSSSSSQTSQAPPAAGAQGQPAATGGERSISGPNSCFNPAQLRVATTPRKTHTRTWTIGSSGKVGAELGKSQEVKSNEVATSGNRGGRDREGGGGDSGQSMGGGEPAGRGIGSVLPGNSEGKEETKANSAELKQGELSGRREKGAEVTVLERTSFVGVRQLNKMCENGDSNGPIPDKSYDKQLNDISVQKATNSIMSTSLMGDISVDTSSKVQNDKESTQEDDLKGFFTMPPPSEKSRKIVHSANGQLEHSSIHRMSPRATEICSNGASQVGSCTDRVHEWLCKTTNSPAAGLSAAKKGSPISKRRTPTKKGTPSPRPSPSSTPTKPPLSQKHKSTIMTRELVRMKMRANLKDEAKNENSFFQNRSHVPPSSQDQRQVSKPIVEAVAPVFKCRTPPNYLTKNEDHMSMKRNGRSPTNKPLFTGLRHINVKSKPVTATVTKTTIENSGYRNLVSKYKIDAQNNQQRQQTVNAAALVPRMSYSHRLSNDLPNNGGPSALANLLPKALETNQGDQLCANMAKVGIAN